MEMELLCTHTSSKYSDQKISHVELKRKQKTAELSNSPVKSRK